MEIKMKARKRFLLISIISLPLIFTACADLFQGKVPMPTSKGGSLDELFYKPEELVKLATPTQFYVSNGYSSQVIAMSWDKVSGATSYLIERAVMEPIITGGQISYNTPQDQDFEIIEQFCYSTSFIDDIFGSKEATYLSSEYTNKYYYRVSAENIGKGYDPSDPTSALTGSLLAAPQKVTADMGESDSTIVVRWEKSNHAVRYNIYRSETQSVVPSNPIRTVTSNQFWYNDAIAEKNQGTEFYYFVEAVGSNGQKSVISNSAMGFTLTKGAPLRPTVSLAQNSGRGDSTEEIKIEWNAVGGAETYYTIYRSSSSDSSLTRVATNVTGTAYTDKKDLSPGLYYFYSVQAIKKNDEDAEEKSQLSESVKAYLLSPPATFAAKKNGSSITLYWTPAIGIDDEERNFTYDIYGSKDLNGNYEYISSAYGSSVDPLDGFIYHDVPNDPLNVEFYKVRTVKDVNPSTFSGPAAAPPDRVEYIVTSQAAYLENKTANSSGIYPVMITWKKPANDNPPGYHIYRSTNDTSGFRKITDNPVLASDMVGGLFIHYDDNDTAKVGKKYYYRILSVNSLGQGDAYSDTATGYGAITHEQYYLEYNKTIKSSHKKLTYLNKSGSTEKLGTETKYGTISGSIYYNAKISGLGAAITMRYDNYADSYVENDISKGVYFEVTGNTNTSAEMDQSGSMNGTMVCTGMYPGKVYYDKIQIKGGNAAGGTYGVEPAGFSRVEVSFTLGSN